MASPLPDGSAASSSGGEACILDCVYHEADRCGRSVEVWKALGLGESVAGRADGYPKIGQLGVVTGVEKCGES